MLVYLRTFGCQMNEYDSGRILRLLEDLDYSPVDEPERADLILLNTCTVRAKSEHKALSELGRFKRLKGKNKGLVIGIGGCVAQQEGRALLGRIPHLDLVFGTQAIERLPELVRRVILSGERIVDVGPSENGTPRRERAESDSELAAAGLGRTDRTRQEGVSAYLSVMRGCNNFCSFCIVPSVRSKERSREPEDILSEIHALVSKGFKEITLLGQNVNSYGKTLARPTSFADLLRMADDVEGLLRIRYTTSHPRDFGDDLIEAVSALARVCEHVHLPVQSGSDRILASMNRGYTVAEYMKKVEKLRRAVPGVALTSDVIVGFPGEEEADFEATMDLLREVRFDGAYSFKYSPRPGTRAFGMADDVPIEEKSRRLRVLQDLQRRVTFERNREMQGHVSEVLIEGRSKTDKDKWSGRARNNKIINFHAKDGEPGDMVNVRITRAQANSLAGEITNPF